VRNDLTPFGRSLPTAGYTPDDHTWRVRENVSVRDRRGSSPVMRYRPRHSSTADLFSVFPYPERAGGYDSRAITAPTGLQTGQVRLHPQPRHHISFRLNVKCPALNPPTAAMSAADIKGHIGSPTHWGYCAFGKIDWSLADDRGDRARTGCRLRADLRPRGTRAPDRSSPVDRFRQLLPDRRQHA
jgi:hypothetical protein